MSVEEKAWKPKNMEVTIQATEDRPMSDKEWAESNFPLYEIPPKVQTHVNIKAWRNQISAQHLSYGETCLVAEVFSNLTSGCDSNVGPPGNIPSVSNNVFSDPAIDIPRIADALATEVKSGHMAGPLPIGSIKDTKVNGFMSVVKPGDARRQVGNLSSPKGASFNEGIPEKTLQQWRVFQTTSRQFALMVSRAGRGSVMSCSDMVAAYKNLPVCIKQRRLQVFRFLGREFVDLRLVFGDRAACMYFDRFHACVILFFVLPSIPFPRAWIGRTVDDITTVSPASAAHMTTRFVQGYRSSLAVLNIGAAPEDPCQVHGFRCQY